jgi:hypothetical protein
MLVVVIATGKLDCLAAEMAACADAKTYRFWAIAGRRCSKFHQFSGG